MCSFSGRLSYRSIDEGTALVKAFVNAAENSDDKRIIPVITQLNKEFNSIVKSWGKIQLSQPLLTIQKNFSLYE